MYEYYVKDSKVNTANSNIRTQYYGQCTSINSCYLKLTLICVYINFYTRSHLYVHRTIQHSKEISWKFKIFPLISHNVTALGWKILGLLCVPFHGISSLREEWGLQQLHIPSEWSLVRVSVNCNPACCLGRSQTYLNQGTLEVFRPSVQAC